MKGTMAQLLHCVGDISVISVHGGMLVSCPFYFETFCRKYFSPVATQNMYLELVYDAIQIVSNKRRGAGQSCVLELLSKIKNKNVSL